MGDSAHLKVAPRDPLRLRPGDRLHLQLAVGLQLMAGAGKPATLKNRVGAARRDHD